MTEPTNKITRDLLLLLNRNNISIEDGYVLKAMGCKIVDYTFASDDGVKIEHSFPEKLIHGILLPTSCGNFGLLDDLTVSINGKLILHFVFESNVAKIMLNENSDGFAVAPFELLFAIAPLSNVTLNLDAAYATKERHH